MLGSLTISGHLIAFPRLFKIERGLCYLLPLSFPILECWLPSKDPVLFAEEGTGQLPSIGHADL